MFRLATILICSLGIMVACATVEEPAQVDPTPTPTAGVCPSTLEDYYLDTIEFSKIVLGNSNNNIEWLLALSDEQILSLGEKWLDRLIWNYSVVRSLSVTVLQGYEAPTERTVPVQVRITAIGIEIESASKALEESLTGPGADSADSIEELIATIKDLATIFRAALSTAIEDIDAIDEAVDAMCDEPATVVNATPVPTAAPSSAPTPTQVPSAAPTPDASDSLTLATAAPANGMATAPNGATVRIVEVFPDATSIILKHDSLWNAPPPEGFRYFMVTVDVGNTSSRSLEFTGDQFFLISGTRTRYDMPPILAIPNSIRGASAAYGNTEVFPSGVARKNVAFLVPNNETGYAIMFDADRYEEDDRAFILLPE